ncbi:MAG: DUF2306 domain-containing protein [Hyphomonas sp.]|nr:DUF2306 domain-containing protein [Hyphomonas sp.]
MPTSPSPLTLWNKILSRTGIAWFCVAAIGQIAFILFIAKHYGVRTAAGNYAGWNDKSLIKGHVPGDDAGNLMFALHVLLASVMTLTGLIQLVPLLRRKFPKLHRRSGRTFLVLACFLALGGLWLTWGRDTYLSLVSAVSVSLNAVLILVCAAHTLRFALARRYADHQRWAMRLFMVANGVWFIRVGLMGWILINQSPRWMNSTMSGPADIVISYGSFLIPLAVLELYSAARRSRSVPAKAAASLLVAGATVFTGIGILGASMFLWF